MLILDLWVISFHPVVVVGLGNDLLFNFIVGHCEKVSAQKFRTNETLKLEISFVFGNGFVGPFYNYLATKNTIQIRGLFFMTFTARFKSEMVSWMENYLNMKRQKDLHEYETLEFVTFCRRFVSYSQIMYSDLLC